MRMIQVLWGAYWFMGIAMVVQIWGWWYEDVIETMKACHFDRHDAGMWYAFNMIAMVVGLPFAVSMWPLMALALLVGKHGETLYERVRRAP